MTALARAALALAALVASTAGASETFAVAGRNAAQPSGDPTLWLALASAGLVAALWAAHRAVNLPPRK